MQKLGYQGLASDECVFVLEPTWILLYVNDILIVGSSRRKIDEAKKALGTLLDVKDMGKLQHFLGVSFVRKIGVSFLHQAQYILEVLRRFGMIDCKPVSTPMCTKALTKSDDETDRVDPRYYQEMIGCLLYISTRTRPDISATVGILCRFSSDSSSLHLAATKRVLRYLKGTTFHGLKLASIVSDLIAFADANWGNDVDERKSTSGILLQLNGSCVSWKTGKQSVTALSTCEAEFVSASEACKEILWARHLVKELGYFQQSAVILYQDNQGVRVWEEQGIKSAKHVAIRGNFVRQHILSGTIMIQYCPTHEMTADILSKSLQRHLFETHRDGLGIGDIRSGMQIKEGS